MVNVKRLKPVTPELASRLQRIKSLPSDEDLVVISKAIFDGVMEQIEINLASLVGGLIEREFDKRLDARIKERFDEIELKISDLEIEGKNSIGDMYDKMLDEKEDEKRTIENLKLGLDSFRANVKNEVLSLITSMPAPIVNFDPRINIPEQIPVVNVNVPRLEIPSVILPKEAIRVDVRHELGMLPAPHVEVLVPKQETPIVNFNPEINVPKQEPSIVNFNPEINVPKMDFPVINFTSPEPVFNFNPEIKLPKQEPSIVNFQPQINVPESIINVSVPKQETPRIEFNPQINVPKQESPTVILPKDSIQVSSVVKMDIPKKTTTTKSILYEGSRPAKIVEETENS